MCTSVLFKDLKNDRGVFGSNLDLPLGDQLAKLVYQFNYYDKDNKLVFQAQNIFGILGSIRTYSAKGKFFVSLNERDMPEKGDNMLKYLFDITWNKTPNPYKLIENINWKAENFDQALDMASKSKLSSPAYLIIGGESSNDFKGCVIEREMNRVHGKYCLDDKTWFLVQTNYDRTLPDPTYDQRRIPMENKIKSIGKQNMNIINLDLFLKSSPNFRNYITDVSDITMSTTLGEFSQNKNDTLQSFNTVWWNYSNAEEQI